MIRALAALKGRHPDLRYELIGKGPDRDPLADLATRLGVADRIEFLGSAAPCWTRSSGWGAAMST